MSGSGYQSKLLPAEVCKVAQGWVLGHGSGHELADLVTRASHKQADLATGGARVVGGSLWRALGGSRHLAWWATRLGGLFYSIKLFTQACISICLCYVD